MKKLPKIRKRRTVRNSFFLCPTHDSSLHRIYFNILNQEKSKKGIRQGRHIGTDWFYCPKGDHCIKLKVSIVK